jgi:hypothetical protein
MRRSGNRMAKTTGKRGDFPANGKANLTNEETGGTLRTVK